MLNHVVVASPMVRGMLRPSKEESLYIVEGSVESHSGSPSTNGAMCKVKISQELLIVMSNLNVLDLVRHD